MFKVAMVVLPAYLRSVPAPCTCSETEEEVGGTKTQIRAHLLLRPLLLRQRLVLLARPATGSPGLLTAALLLSGSVRLRLPGKSARAQARGAPAGPACSMSIMLDDTHNNSHMCHRPRQHWLVCGLHEELCMTRRWFLVAPACRTCSSLRTF